MSSALVLLIWPCCLRVTPTPVSSSQFSLAGKQLFLAKILSSSSCEEASSLGLIAIPVLWLFPDTTLEFSAKPLLTLHSSIQGTNLSVGSFWGCWFSCQFTSGLHVPPASRGSTTSPREQVALPFPGSLEPSPSSPKIVHRSAEQVFASLCAGGSRRDSERYCKSTLSLLNTSQKMSLSACLLTSWAGWFKLPSRPVLPDRVQGMSILLSLFFRSCSVDSCGLPSLQSHHRL